MTSVKKFLFKILVITSVAVIAFSFSVGALGISWTNAPSCKLAKWYSSPTYSLTGSSATAQGSKTYMYFRNYKSLPADFGDEWRALEVWLMEKDTWNADDAVKYYNGEFTGRKLTEFTAHTLISGDIEGSDDATAELYMEMKVFLGGNEDDPMDKYTGSLFQYTYGIN